MALVQVRESRGCAACTCITSQAHDQSTPTRTVTVVNIVGAEVGRHVRIADPPRAALAAPAVLFGIPLLGVLCGAFGMYWIAPLASEDINTLLGATAGLALGVAVARATANLIFPGPNHAPQAVEILPDSTSPL